MERRHLAHDVVAETPAAKGKPVQAFARWHVFQFFYVMAPRPVIGICGENCYCALFGRVEYRGGPFAVCWRAVRSGKSYER